MCLIGSLRKRNGMSFEKDLLKYVSIQLFIYRG